MREHTAANVAEPAGEVTGLTQCIAYAESLATGAFLHGPDGNEGYLALLATARVTGEALTSGHDMQASFAAAAAAAARHATELGKQTSVQEAYAVNPDAGDKDFQTADVVGGPAPDAAAAAPAPGGMTAREQAVLAAWSKLRMADDSAEAQRVRAEAEQIRRRHRPTAEANRYTGTIDLDELNLDPEKTLAEEAEVMRWTADMFDDRIRDGDRAPSTADSALWWHAAADAVDAAAAAEPPASRAPWPGMDDASLHRWRQDEMVLAQAEQLSGDEDTPESTRLLREAEAVERRRKLAHRAAVQAGVTPCVARHSRSIPCVHPDGDHHAGLCFAANGGSWPRHTSWAAPETWTNR